MSWETRWREGRTGWDAGRPSPILEELVASGTLPTGRALVPGCGAGYDVMALAAADRHVVGLDIAPSAAVRFEEVRASNPNASIEIADFFAYQPDERFDMMWDYTFLCAIDPSVREDWVKKVDSLLAPGGELITLLFPVCEEPPFGTGPPHPLPIRVVRALIDPYFTLQELRQLARTNPGREGLEWLARWKRVSG